MPKQSRTPGAHQIDVARALGVPDPRALGLLNEARNPAHRAVSPHRGINPAGNDGLGGGEQFGVGGHFFLPVWGFVVSMITTGQRSSRNICAASIAQ